MNQRFARVAVPIVKAKTETEYEWRVHAPGEKGYEQVAAKAFAFFRANSDGRYSSRNLMRLANLADEIENGVQSQTLPFILAAVVPTSYDEDTEQKKGGHMGMAVWWANSGRCMLAVHPAQRRLGIGSAVLTFIRRHMANLGRPVFWVGRANVGGQMFLLSNALMPTAINSNGAVRYCNETPDEEDAPDVFGDEVFVDYNSPAPDYGNPVAASPWR